MSVTLPYVFNAGTVLTTSAVAQATCPALSQAVIKRAVFNNRTGGAQTVTIYRVPSGGAAGSGNEVVTARTIGAGQTDLAPELVNMVLNAGDTIQALASANTSINCFVSGFVVS